MSPSLGPDPEGRVLDLVDRKVREMLRGDLMSTDVQPRSMRADRLRIGTDGQVLETVNGTPQWAGKSVPVWSTVAQAWTHDGGAAGDQFISNAGPLGNGGNAWAIGLPHFVFDPADYAIAGKTLQGRITASLIPNGVAQGINKQFFVAGVTPGGGTGASLAVIFGGVIVNTGMALAPTSGNVQRKSSPVDVSATPAGTYAFGFTNSGAAAGGSALIMGVEFQVRHV